MPAFFPARTMFLQGILEDAIADSEVNLTARMCSAVFLRCNLGKGTGN